MVSEVLEATEVFYLPNKKEKQMRLKMIVCHPHLLQSIV
jgi:hypothetical protein